MNDLEEKESALNKSLMGATIEEATAELEEDGWKIRISSEDGEQNILTCDYRTDRVNLDLVSGKITNARIY